MATGDQQDQFQRIKALLPRWFADSTPVLDALLNGLAYIKAFLYGLIDYARLQTRVKTATDGWLDMISADFFGGALPRQAGQADADYRNAIIVAMFRELATRRALIQVLTDLTGHAPALFEPRRPLDTGSYGGPLLGYGMAGGYGSLLIPYQAFVSVPVAPGPGVPGIAGYGVPTGGYGKPSWAAYGSRQMLQGAIADADIYAAIDRVKPAATIVWTRIAAAPLA
jgi:hypothetical protein